DGESEHAIHPAAGCRNAASSGISVLLRIPNRTRFAVTRIRPGSLTRAFYFLTFSLLLTSHFQLSAFHFPLSTFHFLPGALPADRSALVLLGQPRLERSEVLGDGGSVHLPLPREHLEHVGPRARCAH